MKRTRSNVLLVLVVTLLAVIGFRLLLSAPEAHAPPQPPLTRVADARSAPEAELRRDAGRPREERRYAHDEIELLPLGMERGLGDPQAVGPRYIGTDVPEAAACLAQARAARAAGEAARARALLEEGLDFDPHHPQLLVELAVDELLQPDERLLEAERHSRRAVELAPMFAEAHYNLACALARQGRAAEAAAALRDAVLWGTERHLAVKDQARKDPDFDRVRESEALRDVLGTP